jgi:hypothetical protein
MRPWVTNKITTMLGFEDDVVIDYVLNILEVSNHFILRLSACLKACLIQ